MRFISSMFSLINSLTFLPLFGYITVIRMLSSNAHTPRPSIYLNGLFLLVLYQVFLPCTWHAYIVLHLSHWLHSRNSLCTILHMEGHSPLLIYGYLWLLTNRSGSGLVLHEAMPSALLRLSEFSCLQLNRNNRPRRCRRNQMGLVRVLFVLLFVLLCAKKIIVIRLYC